MESHVEHHKLLEIACKECDQGKWSVFYDLIKNVVFMGTNINKLNRYNVIVSKL